MNISRIGTVHSPFTELAGMPIQPTGADGAVGTIEIDDAFAEGLKDLDGFSHIILLYAFHRRRGFDLTVVPFMDTEPRGAFSTRAPKRPSAIGLSVVKLTGVEGNVLHVEGVDILDGTPLFDIKPYVPDFDPRGEVRTGWFGAAGASPVARTSDERFT